MGRGTSEAKSQTLRRWHFHRFFWGDVYVDMPLEMSEAQVRAHLDREHFGGNWLSDSLRRGSKYKSRAR